MKMFKCVSVAAVVLPLVFSVQVNADQNERVSSFHHGQSEMAHNATSAQAQMMISAATIPSVGVNSYPDGAVHAHPKAAVTFLDSLLSVDGSR